MKAKKILILHGWSHTAAEKLSPFSSVLRSLGYETLIPNLPGLGSPEPHDVWGISQYAQWIKSQNANFNADIIFGHSFGGQIASYLAARNIIPLSGLVLCEAAAIRKNSPKSIIFSHLKKIAPSFARINASALISRFIQSPDYLNSSPHMRQIIAKVIREDFTHLLPNIKVPTLVSWGHKDQTLPLSIGKQIQSLIPKSKLIIYPDASHSLPYTHHKQLAEDIHKFFSSP